LGAPSPAAAAGSDGWRPASPGSLDDAARALESALSGGGAASAARQRDRLRALRGRELADRVLANNATGEPVEWVNMCLRKIWRVYQRGLERWFTGLLQPVFDGLVRAGSVPRLVQRLRVVEFTLDHEAPYVSNMRRRTSRKDSDLTGVVDLRYTGGARMLLMVEAGAQGSRWRLRVPVLVSDLDIECRLWIKLRLAPMCPWIGAISLAFVGPPNVRVQLSPYNRLRLMRVPVLQTFLTRLLTVDLPGLMVLPERLEIAIPPSVTSVAEAAVGRDTIMRAVASAVLQVDSLEQALLAALPLGPQSAAGGVSMPEGFRGELTVSLRAARGLPVWGLPWQSNPYCRLALGAQAVLSRRDRDTSAPSARGAPVWNQELQFLVEDPPEKQVSFFECFFLAVFGAATIATMRKDDDAENNDDPEKKKSTPATSPRGPFSSRAPGEDLYDTTVRHRNPCASNPAPLRGYTLTARCSTFWPRQSVLVFPRSSSPLAPAARSHRPS
jgi:hypothetical protein